MKRRICHSITSRNAVMIQFCKFASLKIDILLVAGLLHEPTVFTLAVTQGAEHYF